MKDKVEELRAQITRVLQEQARAEPSVPAEYPQELVARVAAYAREQIAKGRALSECAQELGLPKARLHYWVYDRSRRPRAPAPLAGLRPVQVSSQMVPVHDGVRGLTSRALSRRAGARLYGRAVAIELEAALSGCPGAKPRLVHDHGSEFCNTELRAVIKAHDLMDIRTRARHPESNGIVERFNGTVRQDSDDSYGEHYLAAQRSVAQLIHQYNHVRLHAALGYLEPSEVHSGNPEQRREERRQKLQTARQYRATQNRSRLAA